MNAEYIRCRGQLYSLNVIRSSVNLRCFHSVKEPSGGAKLRDNDDDNDSQNATISLATSEM